MSDSVPTSAAPDDPAQSTPAQNDPTQVAPVPDRHLPAVPATLRGYDGPTSTADRKEEALLLATARCALHPLYRRSPGDCFTLLYRAQALNVPVGVALDHIYINTAVGKSGMSAQLMAALLLRAGVTWTMTQETDRVVEFRFKRGRKVIGAARWTIGEAKTAGLTGREHWRLFPTDCLWARAMARGCRRYFSDLVMGMGYTPEELHDMRTPDVAGDETAVAAPVQAVLDEAEQATPDRVRELRVAARKEKLLAVVLPDGQTLEQHLHQQWLLAAARQADAALAGVDPSSPPPEPPTPPVLDEAAGQGVLPCGCPARILLDGAEHVEGVCTGELLHA